MKTRPNRLGYFPGRMCREEKSNKYCVVCILNIFLAPDSCKNEAPVKEFSLLPTCLFAKRLEFCMALIQL